MFRCVSETISSLQEKSGSPITGVILIVAMFISIWILTLLKNPP